MPQPEFDTCSGCGRMFYMKKEWLVYLGHSCEEEDLEEKEK
jgi:hypothetical protein